MVEAREEKAVPRPRPGPRPRQRPGRVELLARRWRGHLWRIVVTTVGSCLRHRVTGLAAEAAFFAVLSVPRTGSSLGPTATRQVIVGVGADQQSRLPTSLATLAGGSVLLTAQR